MNLKSKRVFILIDASADQRQKDFFIRLKNYLDERNQNNVHIYEIDVDSGLDKFFSTLRQGGVDILVLNVQLHDEILREMQNSVKIMAGINVSDNEYFDFVVDASDFDDKSLFETAKKISIVDKLNWDTNFFNISIARLNHSTLSDRLIDFVMDICQQNEIKCLYYAADGNHPISVRLAEKHNFHFSNIRVKYVLNVENETPYVVSKPKNRTVFRESLITDLDRLVEMSKNLYRDSRYYFDINFSDEVCDRLYMDWIKKIATSQKKEDRVYVLSDNDRVIGYIAGGVEFDTVYIFLLGVDPCCRGQSLGKILVSNFIDKYRQAGYSKFEVVTQGRNISAQRVYQTCGFKISSSEIDYHKWF